METYDFLMIAVILGAAAFGFIKGVAWQVASIASIVVSYFVALKFSSQIAPFFGDSAPWNRYVAMLVIYIGCSFAIWMAFRAISEAIERVKLKEFDRQMGGLLGFGKGLLYCVAITFFAVTLLPDEKKEMVLTSRSGHYIGEFLEKAESMVPPEFKEQIGPLIHKVNERINPGHSHDGDEFPTAQGQDPSTATPPGTIPGIPVNIDWSSGWDE